MYLKGQRLTGKEIFDFRAENSGLKGFKVVMQQMSHTAQRAK